MSNALSRKTIQLPPQGYGGDMGRTTPVQPDQADPWAWNQWAQTQDPGMYGWQNQRAVGMNDLSQMKPALEQAGQWNPAWDAALSDPSYFSNPEAQNWETGQVNAGPANQLDLSSLAGYTNANARSSGTNRLSNYFDAQGNVLQGAGSVTQSSDSFNRKDYQQMAIAAAAMMAGGYGVASLAGTAGAGALGAGAGGASGAGTINAGAAGLSGGAGGYGGSLGVGFGGGTSTSGLAGGFAGLDAASFSGGALSGLGGGGIAYTPGLADATLPSDFSGFQNVGAQPGSGLDTSALYNGGDMGGFSGAGAGNGAPMDYTSLYNGGDMSGFGGAGTGSGMANGLGGGGGDMGGSSFRPSQNYGDGMPGSQTGPAGGSNGNFWDSIKDSRAGQGAKDFFSGNGSASDYLRAGQTAAGLFTTHQASKAAQQGEANNLALQTRMYDQNRADNQPLLDLRNGTLPRINALMKDPSSVAQEPGYQFGLKQGQDQIDNSMAARGGYYSGQQMKASQRYGQDYAGTKLDQSLNRLMGVAGLGQVGATANQSNNNSFGQNAGQSMVNSGNTRSSGYIGYGNTLNNGINNQMQDSFFDQYLKRGGR